MPSVIELRPRPFTDAGPDPMTALERQAFFGFYKRHKSRRLFGFFRDLTRSSTNNGLLERYLSRRRAVRCLLLGCSHWANPVDMAAFVRRYNTDIGVDVAALDVLPDAIVEAIARNVQFVPIIAPAQATPFCEESFDVIVADGLLNCCCFEQHAPIVKEMHRIARRHAVLLLGLTHASRDLVVKWSERPIAAYCRPRQSFNALFQEHGFRLVRGSSIITPFAAGSDIATDNCIARKSSR